MSSGKRKALIGCGCLLLIILFLTVAFYPIFSEVRENAHAVQCSSNLKQLGMAFQQYWQENDETMPNTADPNGGHTWREATFRYVYPQSVYHCPNRYDNLDVNGYSQNYAANDSGSFGKAQPNRGKGALAGPGSPPLAYKDYPDPSRLILLLEAENNNRPEFDIDDPVLFGPQTHKLWAGHFSIHTIFLMADGHAKSLPPSATYLNDPKNKTLFNFWYRNTETRLSANGVAVLKDTSKRFHW